MREGEREKGMEGGRKGSRKGTKYVYSNFTKKKEKAVHELNQDKNNTLKTFVCCAFVHL